MLLSAAHAAWQMFGGVSVPFLFLCKALLLFFCRAVELRLCTFSLVLLYSVFFSFQEEWKSGRVGFTGLALETQKMDLFTVSLLLKLML